MLILVADGDFAWRSSGRPPFVGVVENNSSTYRRCGDVCFPCSVLLCQNTGYAQWCACVCVAPTCVCARALVCVYAHMCVCLHVRANMCIHRRHICTRIFIRARTNVQTCTHTPQRFCMQAHTNTHTHTHVHTHT